MTAHCTLNADELAARGTRWHALTPTFVKSKHLQDGLRLVFRPEPGVEAELRELAGLESDCCAFADWRVHADDCCVLVDVTARDDRDVDAIQSMFASLRSTAGTR